MALSRLELKGLSLRGLYEAYLAASRIRILLAEDDGAMRRLLAEALRKNNYDVTEAANGEQLLTYLGTRDRHRSPVEPPDLILSDVRMPGADGLQVLGQIRERDWTTPVILITAFGSGHVHAEALRLGATQVIDKPLDVGQLRQAIKTALASGFGRPS